MSNVVISSSDIDLMQALRDDGMEPKVIAEKFECDVNIIYARTDASVKYLENMVTLTNLRKACQGGYSDIEEPVVVVHRGKIVGTFVPVEKRRGL